MFEDKNMGIPCLGRCLRRVSGYRRVSGCLGMVSRGEKKHCLMIHKKTNQRSENNKKADYTARRKTIIVFHLKNGLPLREQKSGLPLREHQKKRTTAQKTKNMSQKKRTTANKTTKKHIKVTQFESKQQVKDNIT